MLDGSILWHDAARLANATPPLLNVLPHSGGRRRLTTCYHHTFTAHTAPRCAQHIQQCRWMAGRPDTHDASTDPSQASYTSVHLRSRRGVNAAT